jgi:cytoskeletal protein RodZ
MWISLLSLSQRLWANPLARKVSLIALLVIGVLGSVALVVHRAVEREQRRQSILRLGESTQASDRMNAVLLAQKDTVAKAAKQAADSAYAVAVRTHSNWTATASPVRKRLEHDNAPVGADTVRVLIADADSAVRADSTALTTLRGAVTAEQAVSGTLRGQLTTVQVQRDSALRLALRGSPALPPKYGWTVGPFLGAGYGVSRDLRPVPVLAAGVSITWGRRLGAR